MSKRNDLKHSLLSFGISAKSGYLTRDRRKTTINAFVRIIHLRYNQVRSVFQIKGRHLIYFVEQRLQEGIAVRTLQVEMSHIRQILRNAGRDWLCADRNLSNKGLGISTPPGGRMGAFLPISNEKLLGSLQKRAAQNRPGVGLALLLQRTIGLRAEEAIQSSEDVLELWIRQIEQNDNGRPVYLDVYRGTKNGRERSVRLFYPEMVLPIVKAAWRCAHSNGGFLITTARTRELLPLRKAVRSYSDLLRRWGMQSHAARYAFACNQYWAYRQLGYVHAEALVAVSRDLGHGDRRGDDVRRYYLLHRDIFEDDVRRLIRQVPNFIWMPEN